MDNYFYVCFDWKRGEIIMNKVIGLIVSLTVFVVSFVLLLFTVTNNIVSALLVTGLFGSAIAVNFYLLNSKTIKI